MRHRIPIILMVAGALALGGCTNRAFDTVMDDFIEDNKAGIATAATAFEALANETSDSLRLAEQDIVATDANKAYAIALKQPTVGEKVDGAFAAGKIQGEKEGEIKIRSQMHRDLAANLKAALILRAEAFDEVVAAYRSRDAKRMDQAKTAFKRATEVVTTALAEWETAERVRKAEVEAAEAKKRETEAAAERDRLKAEAEARAHETPPAGAIVIPTLNPPTGS